MICGVLGGEAPGEAIDRMQRAAPFPGGGLHSARLGRVSFACRQPAGPVEAALAIGDGLMAVFSGMFDNKGDIAEDLGEAGLPVADRDAAWVLLQAFRHYGVDALRRLRGIFSGAVTDGTRVWMFRDQIGFWPLFYRWDGYRLTFATHARQVTAGAEIHDQPDMEVVENTFFRRLGLDMRCALRGVERVGPATFTVCSESTPVHRRYWDAESLLEAGGLAASDVPERFDQLMQQAVERTFRGDDVVSLSGGIDSPAVAGYAARAYRSGFGRPLSALSVVYPRHPSADESEFIVEVADYLHMPYHLYEAEVAAMDHFDQIMGVLDGPLPLSSLSERLAHLNKARSLGFDVMMTGELAEYVIDMRDHVLSHLVSTGRMRPAFDHLRGLRAGGLAYGQVFRRLLAATAPAAVLDHRRRSRDVPPVVPAPPAWLDADAFPGGSVYPVRQRWNADQLAAFGGPGLAFEGEYAIQALSGVWVRLPWADIDLWEFFLGLRAEIKYPDPWRKTLVRELLDGKIPDSIRYRTSRTFFDASMLEKIDYPALRSWLVDPEFRVTGVDYQMLEEQLESESLSVTDSFWAKDLAAVHAFLSRW